MDCTPLPLPLPLPHHHHHSLNHLMLTYCSLLSALCSLLSVLCSLCALHWGCVLFGFVFHGKGATCSEACAALGHCCVGDVSSWLSPSCAMGCTMAAALPTVKDCMAECDASTSTSTACDARCFVSVCSLETQDCYYYSRNHR